MCTYLLPKSCLSSKKEIVQEEGLETKIFQLLVQNSPAQPNLFQEQQILKQFKGSALVSIM